MRYFPHLISLAIAVFPGISSAADANNDFGRQAQAQDVSMGTKWANTAQDVLVSALSLTGIQYKFGGNTPETGFDCSGFVRYVFKQAASLTLPHSARAISQLGQEVSRDQLQPGDLVFFNTLKSAFSHVGIYLGGNRFIHAPSSGGGIHVVDMNDAYWAKRYNGARRIEPEDAGKLKVSASQSQVR